MATSAAVWDKYDRLRVRGWSVRDASKQVGISERTGWRREGNRDAVTPGQRNRTPEALEPIPYEKLREEAKRALSDFGFFQRRYFGRIATPWQVEAAEQVQELLSTRQKEYAVINAPPGSGKSTTFTLDIPAWLTCRNRAVRGLLGTFRNTTARFYLDRLKSYLTTAEPLHPEPELIQHGLAVEAEASLVQDFGVFKPPGRDSVWSQEAIVVAQPGLTSRTQKEPTWVCYGYESGFLGMRFGIIIWDDLYDPTAIRTLEAVEKQQRWYNTVAERRLEPGGLFVLQGQRFGPADLYRFALDKKSASIDGIESPRKYHHIVFKAHYTDRCEHDHSVDAAYYPQGCLLDPRRVGWDEQAAVMEDPKGDYETLYQQEDTDPKTVLVRPVWVSGGTDPIGGTVHHGCWDPDRGACELPPGLHGQLVSVATADPSPTKFWSIQWWIVRCEDGKPQERYLMDLRRQKMDAPDFLDWDQPTQSFIGLMQEWQARSHDLGHPIGTWIVEKNGAQRFLLQYQHVRRWMADWRVNILPHETERNKSDPKLGVETIAGIWKYGLVRLPGRQGSPGRLAALKLVEEVQQYPNGSSNDCVMAMWFLEWNMSKILPQPGMLPRFRRPSWLRNADTWSWKDKVNA